MNKIVIYSVFLVVIILSFGTWFYLNKIQTQAPENTLPSVTDTTAVSILAGNEKTFIVTGQNFSFSPNMMTVKKGDKVKIIFKNSGGFHDFKIDEFNVATKKIQGGVEETVEFTADKIGSFEYYCSVGEHRAMGMKGTLIVE